MWTFKRHTNGTPHKIMYAAKGSAESYQKALPNPRVVNALRYKIIGDIMYGFIGQSRTFSRTFKRLAASEAPPGD